MSETEKYRHLTARYCVGNGVDIGSGGDPVVSTAIQIDLPADKYSAYRNGEKPLVPIQWTGDCFSLPFKDGVLDYVYSSHLIEDFERSRWVALFQEWNRCLRRSGWMIILVPERKRWQAAVAAGQPPNCNHAGPEPETGEVSWYAISAGLTVIEEGLTNISPTDYSILAVLQKP